MAVAKENAADSGMVSVATDPVDLGADLAVATAATLIVALVKGEGGCSMPAM
jgi:hypothetical protein